MQGAGCRAKIARRKVQCAKVLDGRETGRYKGWFGEEIDQDQTQRLETCEGLTMIAWNGHCTSAASFPGEVFLDGVGCGGWGGVLDAPVAYDPTHIQTSDQVSETDVFDSVPAFARCTYVRGSGGVRGSKGREGRREVGSPTKKSWIDDISGVAGAGDDVDEPLDRPAFEASGVPAIDSLLGANSGDMLPSLLISPVHLGSDQAVLPRPSLSLATLCLSNLKKKNESQKYPDY